MNTIRIRTTLTSDTLHLPELRPLLGQSVEILVTREDAAPTVRPGTSDWAAFDRLAREITEYDFDAQQEQDAVDLHDASDALP